MFMLGKMGMALAHFVKILTWPKARGVKILAGPKNRRLRKILMGPSAQNIDGAEEQKSNDEARDSEYLWAQRPKY